MRNLGRLMLPMLILAGIAASAQTGATAAPTEVRLGESVVGLPGPWRFSPGDSPAWADPGFDDSGWRTMDLRSEEDIDPGYGSTGYLPGWTAKGYPRLSGFAWYRLTIHTSGPMWLKMPDHVDDAYQVFANGKLIGSFGEFRNGRVVCYRSRPLVLALPPPDARGNVVLAIRFYMEAFVLATGTTPDSGGMHEVPLVGLHPSVEYLRSQEVRARFLGTMAQIFVALMMLIAAGGAFWIWMLDRRQPTYLWLMFALLFDSLATAVLLTAFFSYMLSQDVNSFLHEALNTGQLVCWIVFWRRWFQLDRNRLTSLLLVAMSVVVLLTMFDIYLMGSSSAVHFIATGSAVKVRAACDGILGLSLFAELIRASRKDRAGALLALPSVILLTMASFSQELLTWFRLRTAFFPFGVQIDISEVASVLMVLVVGALVARRFIESQVSQRMVRQGIDQEIDQARELQQHVLIPEPIRSALFSVDTAYYPARSVGGDFFQVIPHRDGSLLIVVGDVSGKGMAAAMLVAVLVGAIATRADETFDPAAILYTLNERLLGRAGGHFATCVVAHLRAGGEMRIGNAGHIPPYLNGVAMEIEGSLPLGIVAGVEYPVQTVQTEPGDYLTLMTDGVLEARNASGELLGFERLGEISAMSAEQMARVAMRFGQDDDITVVSVSVREAV